MFCVARSLIRDGLVQAHVAGTDVDDEVPGRIDTQIFRALKGDLNNSGIGAWGHDEVIFQLALTTIINYIYSIIYATLGDLAIVGNIGAPIGGRLSEKIIGLSRQLIQCSEVGAWIRAYHFQMQSRGTPGVPAECKYGFARSQK